MKTDTLKIAAIVSAIAVGLIAASATVVEARERGAGLPGMDFSTLDVDGSGEITESDIETLRETRFAEMDSDSDGVISRAEFTAAMAARAEDRAGEMFDRLDADGDGSLSRDAIEARTEGRRNPARMLERADTDGSGGVSEEELTAMVERMKERRGGRRN